MSRYWTTVCNICDQETRQYKPKGWKNLRLTLQDLGNSANDQEIKADVCSDPNCHRLLVEKTLQEWFLPKGEE